MIKLHDQFPYYDWISNKGYPCEKHYQGLDSHGIQIGVHRTSMWPFSGKPHPADEKSFLEEKFKWKKRRERWRKLTERHAFNTLEGRIWTTKQELLNPSIALKSSAETEPRLQP